ncbi:hypothetical protein PV10_08835 [Exophiala mesophila]|uniref:Ribosomal lysine N-methyltransferase 4 n=1 Tax=Exophiala mesophila TaxID=212818 RepID=A0A0D1XM63_EXOME|nr:uncharacterized protein PV10_08835 [Exophiala mesophila]KIV89256.1 hypothetical protein PV10_08835 [Exophiala mesophila]
MLSEYSAPTAQDFAQKTTNFLNWFTSSHDTRLSSKIQLEDLRSQHAGRGAVATQDIEEDEELFAVPRNLVLTVPTSSIPTHVFDSLGDIGSWPPLIVTIIYEYLRREASPWYPYFQVLPTAFDSLMFWNDQELAQLQASAVIEKIGRAGAEESWKETIIPVMLKHPELFPISGSSDGEKISTLISLAHMAGSLIMAYAFDIDHDDDDDKSQPANQEDEFEEDDEDEPSKGMVPFADMLNADADRNNARLFQESDFLIMKSTKPIKAGDQIFNDYGPLPRSDLLRMYGYVTENYSQYDVVEISYDLLLEVANKNPGKDAASQAWQKRADQLDELGLLDDGYAIPRPSEPEVKELGDAIPGQLHMLLRALASHDQDNGWMNKPKDAVTIEEAALLQAALTKRLTEYSTTLESDRELLQRLRNGDTTLEEIATPDTKPNRVFMALQVRVGEKEILHQMLALCREHISRKTQEIATTNGSNKRKHMSDNNQQSKKTARR